MAKHVILEAYSFSPSTRTVVITGKNIRKEQLLLITDVTTNSVIYNFSDPSLGSTSYTNAVDPNTGQETTTIVLTYNTTALSSTDKLAIMTEETYQEIIPAEVMRDPVDKLRISSPQALIDTDFEYGTQPTKWEGLNLLNNRPSAFIDVTSPLTNITNITASGKVVTVATATPPVAGTPIFLIGTLDGANADGWWIVETVSASTSFTFTTINTPASALFDVNKSYLYPGTFFTGAAIPAGTGAIVLSGSAATVTTTGDHGLRVGDSIYITGTTGATGTLNSTWVVATTPTNTTFTFACTATGTITATLNASIYPRATGYIQHRAFDGGVQFSNLAPYHGYQVIRQTRRQFRYQSGKGIQFSTGSIMKPTLNVDGLTSSGTTVTVTTKFAHGLLPGAQVIVSGCNETAYNGTFTVTAAPTALTITYTASSTPSSTTASGNPVVSPYSWYGSTNRIGMFDSQNGFYFEFDGQTLYAVKRSSTYQISGVVAVNAGSQSVAGTNTKFSQQLKPGDSIVIRGMSYLVQQITSDTQMYIYPEYRGSTNVTNTVVSKTVNTRYPQSAWNIDKMDGTGVSLMNLDLTKMQMFYADYTWYGAGAIRFGFKDNRGQVVYCHRIPNNNVNTEAYMRSGNMVARYETATFPYYTYLTATLANSATTGATISVGDTTGWPASGTVVLTSASATGALIEYVTYSSKTSTSLTISARAQTGGQASAQTFTVTGASVASPGGTAPIRAELYSPQAASTISHWGSSVIMDGRYDDDKSLVFNAGSTTALINMVQNVRTPILSIRIAPSVDNGSTGLLGTREILNRMQLTLRQMDVYTSGSAFKMEVFLNGRLSTGTFASVGGSSLAQVAYHTTTTTITGGESIFGFFTSNAGSVTQDLSIVRDIGNSIMGGGTSFNVPTTGNNLYPDGPDILTVCCTNITPVATNTINSRLSWTEAQA
jgi:hypothetical protein